MSYIKDYINGVNTNGRKVLSVFLTAGFPKLEGFTDLAKSVLDAGADMLEIGIPFSDPLADGPIIQHSSQSALSNGVNMKMVFSFADEIAKYSAKPVVLMGYANPVLNYGLNNFFTDSVNTGISGIIIPDIPLEEYDEFYKNKPDSLDAILLAAPTSGKKRIKLIDKKSCGFVYCVSMTGTTGGENNSSSIEKLKEIRSAVTKNKMLIGFGISKPEDIENYAPYCDGVIVGSAVIKSIRNKNIPDTLNLIKGFSKVCSK